MARLEGFLECRRRIDLLLNGTGFGHQRLTLDRCCLQVDIHPREGFTRTRGGAQSVSEILLQATLRGFGESRSRRRQLSRGALGEVRALWSQPFTRPVLERLRRLACAFGVSYRSRRLLDDRVEFLPRQ